MQPAADGVVYVGAGYGHEAQVVKVVLDGPKVTREVVHAGRELPVDIGYLIEPESITFPTGDGDAVAHALYYPPTNPDHVGVEGPRRRCWFSPTAARPPRPAANSSSAFSIGPAGESLSSTSTTAAPPGTAVRTARR